MRIHFWTFEMCPFGDGLKPELARLKEDVRLQSTAKEVCSLLFDSACPFVCFFLSSLRGKGGVVMNGMRRESLLLLCRSPLRRPQHTRRNLHS